MACFNYVANLSLSYFPEKMKRGVVQGIDRGTRFPARSFRNTSFSNRFYDLLLSDMLILLAIKHYVNKFFDLYPNQLGSGSSCWCM